MREPWEWEESDILSLLDNRVPESLKLEFKACDALTNKHWRPELVKDVSAFANSVGGTIVYGIKEDKETHEAESLDEGYDPSRINKERLEQIIDDNIERSIEGIRYNAVRLDSTRPGKVAFVISVPQSTRSPHMANHHYYKRLEFESKAMEEYEVRERYGRVTFPGKDVVEAWRDDAINPVISALESEELCLTNEHWTWNHYYDSFGGLKAIGQQETFSANAEDFITRHAEISDLLGQHDGALVVLNTEGAVLFEEVAKSSFIRDIFTWATSEESLGKIQAENPNTFKGTSATDIYNELFGRDRIEQDRFDHFAEWAINGVTPTNIDEMLVFWRAFGDRFRTLVIYPPLDEYRRKVEDARENLLQIGQCLTRELKKIRRELSEKHNIAQASRPSLGDRYDGLSVRARF